MPDARVVADELTAESIKLDLGGALYDPTDPMGRLLFNTLAMVAEFSVIWTEVRWAGPDAWELKRGIAWLITGVSASHS